MVHLPWQKSRNAPKSIASDVDGSPPSHTQRDVGVLLTQIGLYSNLFMAIAKGILGYMFNSKAMLADAIHGATDLTSDVVSLITIAWSLKNPSKRYPYGYRKIECLGTLAVSSILIISGGSMSYSGITSLLRQLFRGGASDPELHHQLHVQTGPCRICGLVLSMATIGIKEWLYQATMKVAKRRDSSILAANAIHHRFDCFTEIILICTILLVHLTRDTAWLDTVGGLIISFTMIKPAAEIARSALCELCDQGIDDDTELSIRERGQDILVKADESRRFRVKEVSGTKSGRKSLIELKIAVPNDTPVWKLGELESRLQTGIKSSVGAACQVRVSFVAIEASI